MSAADTPNTKVPNVSTAASPVEVVAPATSPVAAVKTNNTAATTSTNAKNVAVVNNKPANANANTGSGHIATLLETGEKLSLGELTIVEDGGMKYGVLPLSEETVSELRNKYGSSSPNGAAVATGGSRKRKAKKSRKTRSKK